MNLTALSRRPNAAADSSMTRDAPLTNERPAMRHITGLTSEEIADLLEAIETAQQELCIGPTFPEATALSDRWDALTVRLEAIQSGRAATAD